MQWRLAIEGSVLRGFGIRKFIVLGHFGDDRGGLRTKPICSFLPPPRYFSLETGHLDGHIAKTIFISSGRTFRVLRTVRIGPKRNLRWKRDSGWPKTAIESNCSIINILFCSHSFTGAMLAPRNSISDAEQM
ncbi:hypothetical protein GUJ93_ZPchr0005g15942 [Zizania palustris]|uniref:Uncharacterized protein n=1 Tax=Zizania palustris TaxID=103762 RepID=A0A8J5W145_ZIZPA|nr:hypothetical protein GUJ93_ZPchr0005g15942 [Zizania palustris]